MELAQAFILLTQFYEIPVQSKECPPEKPLLPNPRYSSPATYTPQPAGRHMRVLVHVGAPVVLGEK